MGPFRFVSFFKGGGSDFKQHKLHLVRISTHTQYVSDPDLMKKDRITDNWIRALISSSSAKERKQAGSLPTT